MWELHKPICDIALQANNRMEAQSMSTPKVMTCSQAVQAFLRDYHVPIEFGIAALLSANLPGDKTRCVVHFLPNDVD
jgi:hypothetical protein